MYSHEELISAVRAAGSDGKTFTAKDVRTQLGFDGRDKKEASRFRRRLRAFEKVAGDQLEKLGNNSYRLRSGAFEGQEGQEGQKDTPARTQEIAAQELHLERASGVFETTLPANQPEELPAARPAQAERPAQAGQPERPAQAVQPERPAQAVQPERPAHAAQPEQPEQPEQTAQAAQPEQPAQPAQPEHAAQPAVAAYEAVQSAEPSGGAPRRLLSVATATTLVSSAFAASASVSGRVREHSRNLREQLWSCLRSAPARRHAIARLRGWAEGLRPLSIEVREQLHALRQRVLASRRRAA